MKHPVEHHSDSLARRCAAVRARWTRRLVVAVICICSLAPLASAQSFEKLSRSDLKTLQASFADLSDEVRPSVVAIRTYQGMRPFSQGTGVIFRANGYVVTNYHVIEDAPDIMVVLHNGEEYQAYVMQVDERSDLAVIKIDADGLRAARLGDLENVRVGHWTFAVGNPFGLSNDSGSTSFSVGNVSSIGRNLSNELDHDSADRRYYGNLIETSAAINPGNSGGPLFNIDGEVIGIVSAIETRSGVNEGVGFAIPISERTRTIIDKLAAGEEVRYGYLGVEIGEAPADQSHEVGGRKVRGARVASVVEHGPADRAGLHRNDVIIELEGVAIESADHLVRAIGALLPGSGTDIRYVRKGTARTTTVELADRALAQARPSELPAVAPASTNWRGAVLAEMTDMLKREHGLADQEAGLMVLEVRAGSDAAKRGLEPSQIIMSVNGERVTTLQQFAQARQRSTDTIRLGLQNREEIRFPRG